MVFIPRAITKKPSLGRIPKDAPKETQKFLKSIKEVLEVGEGKRGDSMDRYLTLRHLREAGLVESLSDGSIVASPTIPTFSDISQFPGYTTQTPEAPSNVTVTGGFSYIFVKWDVPVDPDSIILHAEVWRSETDALGAATLRGTSPSSFYVDEVGTGSVTYYYWVRFVSKWGSAEVPIEGPYNAVAGTSGATVMDPAYVLEVLTDQIGESQLNQSLGTLVDKIEPNEVAILNETTTRSFETGQLYGSWTLKTAYEQSNGVTYVSGFGTSLEVINGNPVSNFIIKADNFAVGAPGADDFFLTAGTVNGVQAVAIGRGNIKDLAVTNAAIETVAADKIFAASGTLAQAFIGQADITNAMIGNVIQSDNYVSGVSGWLINKDGFAEFQNANVTGNITANSINANSVDIISTLMLQDQAVTFPIQTYYAPTAIHTHNIQGGTSSWVTVTSLVIPSQQGAPQFMSFSGRFRLSTTHQGSIGANSLSKFNFEYRVTKNGSEIRSPTRISTFYYGFASGPGRQSGVSMGESDEWGTVSFNLYEQNSAGSNNTYVIEMRVIHLSGSAPNVGVNIDLNRREAGLMSLEAKK